MLAEVVVVVVVVVVEVEFGTVGIETSVSWEQLWLLWHSFTLLCRAHHNHHHLLVEIANNITSDAIQGHSNPFPNEYERCLLSQKLLFEAEILMSTVIQLVKLGFKINSVLLLSISIAIFLQFKRRHNFVKV